MKMIIKKLDDIYKRYWIDIVVFLIVLLFLGIGLWEIKISNEKKNPIEVINSGVYDNGTEKENSSLIDINTADQKELEKLPNIGNKLAEEIVTYREENGPFKSVDELKNVPGIGDKKFEDIKDLIIVK